MKRISLNERCSVCHRRYGDYYTANPITITYECTVCGKWYCADCYNKSFDSEGNGACPICGVKQPPIRPSL